MEYKIVERDFVMRTLEIVKQYNQYVSPSIPSDKRFEVTLLLNCLMGLVVLPFEQKKRLQNDTQFPILCNGDDVDITKLNNEWGLNNLSISKFSIGGKPVLLGERTLRRVVAMIRHSVAHSHFGDGVKKPMGVSVNYAETSIAPIESIIVQVYFSNMFNSTEFEALIPVSDLQKFAMNFAKIYLQEFE